MGEYLDYFNEQIAIKDKEQEKNFISALIDTLDHYLKTKYPEQSSGTVDEAQLKIQVLLDYLKNTCEFYKSFRGLQPVMGKILCGYSFKSTKQFFYMPDDFMEVFEAAQKMEAAHLVEMTKNTRFSASEIIEKCKNNAAAAQFNLESLIQQIIVLEEILKNNIGKFSFEEVSVIKKQICEWKDLLPYKVAELILSSRSFENVKYKIDQVLRDERINDSPVLAIFKEALIKKIDFLNTQKFFSNLYCKKHKTDKYRYLIEFKDELFEKNLLFPFLDQMLAGLIKHIIEKEYQRFMAEKNRLMEMPDATVDEVVYQLSDFVTDYYLSCGKQPWVQDLYKKVMAKLKNEFAIIENWQCICIFEAYQEDKRLQQLRALGDLPVPQDKKLYADLMRRQAYRTYRPLMKDVFRMRYLEANPKKNPIDELCKLVGNNPDPEFMKLCGINVEASEAVPTKSMSSLSISKT